MVLGNSKHALDSVACTLFTELHLEDGIVNRFSRYLPTQHVQLSVRDFEVCSGIFMLEHFMKIRISHHTDETRTKTHT